MYFVIYVLNINFKSCMYCILRILILEIAITVVHIFMGRSGLLEFFLGHACINIFGPTFDNKILLFNGWVLQAKICCNTPI